MELHAIGMQRSGWSKTRSLRPPEALPNKGWGDVFQLQRFQLLGDDGARGAPSMG